MTKIDPQLFAHAAEHQDQLDEACPQCQAQQVEAKLQLRYSKHGGFIGCENYPQCDYHRPLTQHENLEAQVIEGSECPECGHELAVKSGRFGIFIGCTNYPSCQHIEKPETEQQVTCPLCQQGDLEQRTNRFGKSFFACQRYPQCNYLVNYPPIAESCPDCGFGILVKRKTAAGERLECPQKTCKYKRAL